MRYEIAGCKLRLADADQRNRRAVVQVNDNIATSVACCARQNRARRIRGAVEGNPVAGALIESGYRIVATHARSVIREGLVPARKADQRRSALCAAWPGFGGAPPNRRLARAGQD